MGSLMAGWNSHMGDEKSTIYQRNKSCTREEIEEYWRSKNMAGEHLKQTSTSSQESTHKDLEKLPRSNSLPLTDRKGGFLAVDAESAIDKLRKDWWTRTHWAFLNEPPVINTESSSHTYTPQYHVVNPT